MARLLGCFSVVYYMTVSIKEQWRNPAAHLLERIRDGRRSDGSLHAALLLLLFLLVSLLFFLPAVFLFFLSLSHVHGSISSTKQSEIMCRYLLITARSFQKRKKKKKETTSEEVAAVGHNFRVWSRGAKPRFLFVETFIVFF